MTQSKQEEQIDNDLAQIGVKVHITHLKHPEDSYYKVVTVATSQFEPYSHLSIALSGCYHEARVSKRSDFGTLIIDRFDKLGYGVALCHHLDNFSQGRGRIIAKGRLLKLLKPGVI